MKKLALLLVLIPLALLFAESGGDALKGQGQAPDKQTAAFRSALSSADTTTLDTAFIDSTTPGQFLTGARANVSVGARFSAASQTCAVRLLRIHKAISGTRYVLGISDPVTLTGTSFVDGGSKYMSQTVYFDANGADEVRVVLSTAPSSGTVDLWVGSF